ncbi:filament integrity protein fraC [Scytonema sp. UIC 10036]|uniref:filament integrity protein FraC n=1 Tax=Scytonema sp. UIC 10036 TaxID=2304196 RepID=UPI0012DA65AA|nr:filament integrity protein FraC [Scytonema sp. UIC 10036]MUG92512.1 filament integrity protein fraC [Scytonema sp. UIC 10036]
MFELPEFPLPRIFPFGAILFNFLFLLVAIPIESFILNSRLKFDRKSSVFYAIAINLFSNVIGWVVFFFSEPVLPIRVKSELINYIFFDRLQSANVQSLIVLTAFIIFFGTFLVKYILLRVLLLSLAEFGKAPPAEPTPDKNLRRVYKHKLQNTSVVTSILIANALSYSFIVAVLFIRSFDL